MSFATTANRRVGVLFMKELIVLAMAGSMAFAQLDLPEGSAAAIPAERGPAEEGLRMEWESGKGRCPAEPPEVLGPPESGSGVSGVAVPRGDFVPAWHEMFTNLPADWGRSFRMTFRSSSIPTVLGLSAVTLGLIAIDHHTYRAASRFYKTSPVVESATDFFVSLGDGQSQFLLAGAFAAYGFAASDRRAIRTASQTVEAVLATGVFIQVLKHISGRESPAVVREMKRSTWRPFPNLKDYHSHQAKYYAFPSGHIATSMAALTVIADNYHDVDWIRPVGYPLVGLIGISLVNNGFHWYSDLPLGLAIGYLMGKAASHPKSDDEEIFSENKGMTICITPAVSVDGGGVQFAVLF